MSVMYQHCKTDVSYDIYKVAKNRATLELRKYKYLYEKDLTTRIKSESKLFWSHGRSKTKTKGGGGGGDAKMIQKQPMCYLTFLQVCLKKKETSNYQIFLNNHTLQNLKISI